MRTAVSALLTAPVALLVATAASAAARPVTPAAYAVSLRATVEASLRTKSTQTEGGCTLDVTGGRSHSALLVARSGTRVLVLATASGARLRPRSIQLMRSRRRAYSPTYYEPRDCAGRAPFHGDPPAPVTEPAPPVTVRIGMRGVRVALTPLARAPLGGTVEACGRSVAVSGLERASAPLAADEPLRGRSRLSARASVDRATSFTGRDGTECRVDLHVDWTLVLTRLPRA